MSVDYRSLSGPKRLGDRLLEAGLITRTHLDQALEQQDAGVEPRPRLGRTLVELGFVAERDLMQMLSIHLAVPLASLPLDDGLARRPGAVVDPDVAVTAPDALPTPTARLGELVTSLRELADGHHRLSRMLASAEEESRRLAVGHERIRTALAQVREDAAASLGPLLDAARQLAERAR